MRVSRLQAMFEQQSPAPEREIPSLQACPGSLPSCQGPLLSLLLAGSIDIMSTPEDVAEQQRRLKPNVVVAQYMFDKVRLACS